MSMSDLLVAVLVVVGIMLIAVFGAFVFMLVKFVKLGKTIHSDLMPLKGKIAFWTGLAYAISPLDLLPDPIYLDDIGILIGCAVYLTRLAREYGVLPGAPAGNALGYLWDQGYRNDR
jgi:Protein of unknown function (DUF1232)